MCQWIFSTKPTLPTSWLSFNEVGAGGEEVQLHSESFDLSNKWANSPNVWAKKLPCFSTINPSSGNYLLWFHAGPFLPNYEWRSNINLELPDQRRLLVCSRRLSPSFVETTSYWVWRRRWGKWGTLASQVCMSKTSWFQETHWGIFAHWIWPTVWEGSPNNDLWAKSSPRSNLIRLLKHFAHNENIIYSRNLCWFGGM